MLHPIFVGFFDRERLKWNDRIIVKKIDMDLVSQRLAEVGQLSPDGKSSRIQGDVFVLGDGYFASPDVIRSEEAAKFVADVARVAACEIVLYNADEPYTAEQYLHHFYELQRWKRNYIASRKSSGKKEEKDQR